MSAQRAETKDMSPLDRAVVETLKLVRDGLVALTIPAVLANTKWRRESLKEGINDSHSEFIVKAGHFCRVVACWAMAISLHHSVSLEAAALFYAYGAAGIFDGIGLIGQSIAGDKPE